MKRLLFISLFLLSTGCAKVSSDSNPSSYYVAYKKYSPVYNDFLDWSGFTFLNNGSTISFNFASSEFDCVGYVVYSANGSMPVNIGEKVTLGGSKVSGDECFPNLFSADLELISPDNYLIEFNSESFYIKKN